jgi:hypothetical protein
MRRVLWLLAVVVVVLLGVGIYVVVRDERLPIEVPVGKGCKASTDAGTLHLYPEQMANAATIAAVGLVKGVPDSGVVIALATAMQESDLYNLNGGDRDSIGLFQQRPSMGWGTAEQVGDPRYAASAFYRQLLRTPGWEQMRITEAAQAVQRSAYPEAYQKWADEAHILGDALVGATATAITCAKVGEPTLRGAAAAQALAAGLQADWGQTVDAAASTAATTLSLVADHERGGWQLAHWLVAHSVGQNVSRVSYGEYEWTVQSGEWTKVSAPPGDSTHVVVADVYAG